MSRCKSCAADIRWAITTSGKRMPVDANPHPEGNVELVQGGVETLALVHTGPSVEGERHLPHHATCPDASKWRRR